MKSERVNVPVRLDKRLKARLDRLARKNRRSATAELGIAVEKHLKDPS
jgi:predicted transcriptional regulator